MIWSRVMKRPNKADRDYILSRCEPLVGEYDADTIETIFRKFKAWEPAKAKKWPVRLFWESGRSGSRTRIKSPFLRPGWP